MPVRVALEELGYSADEAVFVGDSPHDMYSGNGAGVVTIAALWGPFTREQLEPSSPSRVSRSELRICRVLLDRIESERSVSLIAPEIARAWLTQQFTLQFALRKAVAAFY